MARLDAHLASQGIYDPRAVGAHKTRLGLAFQRIHDLEVKDKKTSSAAAYSSLNK
jgi:hypothetical protein